MEVSLVWQIARYGAVVCGLLLGHGGIPVIHAASRAASQEGAKAASTQAIEARRDELQQLHGRLKKLHQDIAKTEETRDSTRTQLKETETAINETRRHLRVLGEQRGAAESALERLQDQSERLEGQISTQQIQLGQLLRRQYIHGNVDTLRLLLSGQGADQVMRDLHYMTLLSHAKADLLEDLRQALSEKKRLGDVMQKRQEEVLTIEKRQQQQQVLLLEQQQQRQQVLLRLGKKLKTQQQEAETLQRNEKRLGSLIDQLVSQSRARARAQARRKADRLKKPGTPPRSVASSQDQRQQGRDATDDRSGQQRQGKVERNEQEPVDMGVVSHFNTLKGRLRLPVRGEILHRFGTPRAGGGGLWKGVFIRATEATEVKSVAPGRVVFADTLRGFGALIIIDHGEGWLSVYGNNQSLSRRVDDVVKAGDAIAMVGHDGVSTETGLYFELRQQGRAIDPSGWVTIR